MKYKLDYEVIVLKLSGRLFFSEEFDKIVSLLKEFTKLQPNLRIVIVAGGGKVARQYIEIAREVGADQASLDELGIEASRLNALVLVKALGKSAAGLVPRTLESLVETFEITQRDRPIVVVGGLQPGQSTNGVGALISEKLRAKAFVNATDVEGVYTSDPRKNKTAELLSEVTPEVLEEILSNESIAAGGYDLMDPIALKLIKRSSIDTRIIKCDSATLRDFFENKENVGTRIVFKN
jgi:uridylate kinase